MSGGEAGPAFGIGPVVLVDLTPDEVDALILLGPLLERLAALRDADVIAAAHRPAEMSGVDMAAALGVAVERLRAHRRLRHALPPLTVTERREADAVRALRRDTYIGAWHRSLSPQ